MSRGHRRVRVAAPASTANLGPGFDVLGLALKLYNRLELSCPPPRKQRDEASAQRALEQLKLKIEVEGEGAQSLPRGRRNLVFRAAARVFRRARRVPEELVLRQENHIPLARGLGSSGAATLAGLLAANEVCGRPLSRNEILRLGAELEGHADNIAAALLGGLTAVVLTERGPLAFALPLRDRYRCVLAIPAFELRTRVARRCLPPRIRRADAIYSLGRTAALCGLLAQGAHEGVAEAMRDRLHQPQRARLVPGLAQVIEAAIAAGALGAALSGAGPTVMALVPAHDRGLAEEVGRKMVRAFARAGIESRWLSAAVDRRGARVLGS